MKRILWFCILAGLMTCAQRAKAQPPPANITINSSNVSGGTIGNCLNITSAHKVGAATCGAGGGVTSVSAGTGISVNQTTGAVTVTNTAPGASPSGSTGCLQDYATSTTFGCSSIFFNGTSFYGFGVGNGPGFQYVDNNLWTFPNQNLSAQSILGIFNAGGGSGSDLNGIALNLLARVDSVTKYWDSQIDFAPIADDYSYNIKPYVIGAEGHCNGVNDCNSLADYDFFLINTVTGHTLLENTSTAPNQLDVPATTQFATLGTYVAAQQIVSNDTTDANPLLLSKNAIADSAPGAAYVSFKAVAGTNMGTCKIVMKAGTSATPVTLVDNVGSGC